MKYLSVCSGIEAATVAWHPLGFEPVAFAEIELFPSAVLAHRFPAVPNMGDMTKYKEWDLGTIDILVGGTPCQSFSVAGLRKGLADPRGNLMLTYGAIADHFRPTWIVWENVPGVLSSNRGRDFGTFLGMLAELGYGFAYRVLDAQFYGVAQRRRRVFVVGYLGDWRRAAAVLFESESLQWNPAPSRETGKGFASVAGTLAANGGGTNRPAGNCNELDFCIPVGIEIGPQGAGFVDTNPTLDTRAKDGPIRNQLSGAVMCMAHSQANAEIRADGGAPTLTCNHEAPIVAHTLRGCGFDASEDGTGRGTPLVPIAFHNRQDPDVYGDMAPPLGAKDNGLGVKVASAVRRLTPRECERLQGFPDDWTLITWRGRPTPDGPRYKAIGNSMAVPVMRWIGERIKMQSGCNEKQSEVQE